MGLGVLAKCSVQLRSQAEQHPNIVLFILALAIKQTLNHLKVLKVRVFLFILLALLKKSLILIMQGGGLHRVEVDHVICARSLTLVLIIEIVCYHSHG